MYFLTAKKIAVMRDLRYGRPSKKILILNTKINILGGSYVRVREHDIIRVEKFCKRT